MTLRSVGSSIEIDSNTGGIFAQGTNVDFQQTDLTIRAGSSDLFYGVSTGNNSNESLDGLFFGVTYMNNSKTTFSYEGGVADIVGNNGVVLKARGYGSYASGFTFSWGADSTEIEALDNHGWTLLGSEIYGFKATGVTGLPENIKEKDIVEVEFKNGPIVIKNIQTAADETSRKNALSLYGLSASGIQAFNVSSQSLEVIAQAEGFDLATEVVGLNLSDAPLVLIGTDLGVRAGSTLSEDLENVTGIRLSDGASITGGSQHFGRLHITAQAGGLLANAVKIQDAASKFELSTSGGLILGNIDLSEAEASQSALFNLTTSSQGNGLAIVGNVKGYAEATANDENARIHLGNAKDVWLVTEDAVFSNLALENGATLSLNAAEASDLIWAYGGVADNGVALSEGYRRVTLKNFDTANANFRLRVSQDSEEAYDRLIFDESSGSVRGTVDVVLSGSTRDQGFEQIANGFIRQENANATVELGLADRDGDGISDRYVALKGGAFGWQLGFKVDGAEEIHTVAGEDGGTLSSNGKGDWLLVRTDDVPVEVADALAFGTSASQAISWLDGLSDLRKRLGDVRHGTRTGAWAKVFHSKSRFTRSGFEQRVGGVHVGADGAFSVDSASTWLAGASFRYSRADQDGIGEAAHGTSDMDEYALKLYATYMHENGFYADFVAHAGWYETDIEGRVNDLSGSYKADYGVLGTGLSMEVGKTFYLNGAPREEGAWFIEPQAQFSILHVASKSYGTSTGLRVNAEGVDFVTGRLGFEAGKTLRLGTGEDASSLKLAVLGGMTHEFDGESVVSVRGNDGARSFDATDIDGTRWYYGVSADWVATDTFCMYGRVEREEGNGYTKDYDFSIGFRYMW